MHELGKTLYNFYRQACAEHGALMDDWETLPKEDKEDWDLAASLFGDWVRS